MTRFPKTLAALTRYDEADREIDAQLARAGPASDASVSLFAPQDAAWRRVLEAFASETDDYNDRETGLMLTSPRSRARSRTSSRSARTA